MHPNKKETEASHAAKLSAMTSNYGGASKRMYTDAPVDKFKSEGGEEDVGYGADVSKPKLHGARRARMTKPTNPYATYKRGGRVHHRADGGVANDDDIENADIQEKLASHRRGGKVKHRADGGPVATPKPPLNMTPDQLDAFRKAMRDVAETHNDMPRSGYGQNEIDQMDERRGGRVHKRADGGPVGSGTIPAQWPTRPPANRLPIAPNQPAAVQGRKRGGAVKGSLNNDKGGGKYGHDAIGPGGGLPSKKGYGTTEYPKPVRMGEKDPTWSTEPSPSPVDNRARGGRTGGKAKKGGNHVNIMIAPQQHGQPGAMPPPVSALPVPPPMPKPPGGPPGMPPGMPPGGGPPPGGMPPGGLPPAAMMAPGAMPPGIMPPRKHGGRVVAKHDDAKSDMHLIKHMVKKDSLKPHGSMKAAGGRINMTAGAASGEGRLEKAHFEARHHSRPQKV